MVEGVPTELLRIVYEILFSNAPKTPYFTRDFLIAGIAVQPYKKSSGLTQNSISLLDLGF